MASPLNSEFNYRTQVIGETPWAKLQTLKGFLEGRKRALALNAVAQKKRKSKELKLERLRNEGNEEEALLLEAELIELDSTEGDFAHALKLAEDEVVILERLIAEVKAECEKTRLPGYTDDQMIEANAEFEFAVSTAKDLYAEILCNGRPNPATIRHAMSSQAAWDMATSLNLINKDALRPVLRGESLKLEKME